MIWREGKSRLRRIQFYQNGRRIRVNTGLSDKAQAQKKLAQCVADANRSEYIEKEERPLRVAELYEYMKLNASRPEESHRRWLHLEPVFGAQLASRVTTDQCLAYRKQRKEEGAAPATVNRELATLRHLFRLASRATPPKVSRVPHIPMERERNTRTGFVTDAEFARLAAGAGEPWLRLFLELAFPFGWRKGELLNLRVRHVDLLSRKVRLDPGTTKNQEGREVGMTARVAELLRMAVAGKQVDDYVLTREDGKPVRDFRKAWRNLTARAELPGLLVHDLRRSAARALRAAGIPESVVMATGGWKTAAMFRRYAIVSSADQQNAMDQLERARAASSAPISAPFDRFAPELSSPANPRKPM